MHTEGVPLRCWDLLGVEPDQGLPVLGLGIAVGLLVVLIEGTDQDRDFPVLEQ
jgi:hypothetical protein